MEGPLTCPKEIQAQECQVLSGVRRIQDHVTFCCSEGEEGRQTDPLVTWSHGIWPPCFVGLVQLCSTVAGSGYRRKTLVRQNHTCQNRLGRSQSHFLGTPILGCQGSWHAAVQGTEFTFGCSGHRPLCQSKSGTKCRRETEAGAAWSRSDLD